MRFQNPVIVIPGITATDLVDDYPLKADEIWTMVFNKEYERVALHPDDLRYEAVEPAHVIAGRLFPVYDDLIRALRHELSERADQPTPVFAFPYDWRMDVRATAAKLGSFVDEVIARTKLLKHYAKADGLSVDLVGHSMGGLVITEYLAQRGRQCRVGKVVTIGTPYLGSIEAIVKMTTGMSLITGPEPKEREREAARVTPALYQLLPSYSGATIDAAGKAVDIFDCRNIQASILDSLTEFVRLYSVSTLSADRRARAISILEEMLANAKQHRRNMEAFRTADARLRQDDWLAIVGVGERTRVQMTITGKPGSRRFVINENQFVNELGRRDPKSLQTSDGTVPLEGAIPPFLPATRLVCVKDDDLEFLELRDRIMVGIGGFHGLLPRINLVQRLVTKHLKPDYHGPVWGRRLPGARSWNPPIEGLEERAY
ncbi:MAG: alpha/beta hydrolase [Gammaproteobacteria bacterium]|nr:alpha/beta hydrolase [Gammaproteobacteria bacterium]